MRDHRVLVADEPSSTRPLAIVNRVYHEGRADPQRV